MHGCPSVVAPPISDPPANANTNAELAGRVCLHVESANFGSKPQVMLELH